MATEFTLDDFAKQLQQLRGLQSRPDPVSEVLDYFRESRQDTLARVERIIAAIPPEERSEPGRVSPAERARIATASGVGTADVDHFLAGFERLQGRMAEIARLSILGRLRLIAGPGCASYLIPWVLIAGLVAARVFGW